MNSCSTMGLSLFMCGRRNGQVTTTNDPERLARVDAFIVRIYGALHPGDADASPFQPDGSPYPGDAADVERLRAAVAAFADVEVTLSRPSADRDEVCEALARLVAAITLPDSDVVRIFAKWVDEYPEMREPQLTRLREAILSSDAALSASPASRD